MLCLAGGPQVAIYIVNNHHLQGSMSTSILSDLPVRGLCHVYQKVCVTTQQKLASPSSSGLSAGVDIVQLLRHDLRAKDDGCWTYVLVWL